ncbi:MAG TPA: Na+/H+ antiporter subunit D [Acidimicrobiia bacterium]|nr:Na+/H+ antiporter subunit D [Acidimicrobiia bacterium]
MIALPVALPLLAAALSIVVGRWRNAQRAISVATLAVLLAVAVAILVDVDVHGAATAHAGGWAPPLGITLVADRFAALMLVTAAVMLLSVLLYAIGQGGTERRHVGFHPVYLVLAAGISSSFLTGDLFNLFVSFEVMLTASYVLLTFGGRSDQVRTGMTYVVISLIASAVFLAAIAFTYAAAGTVNLADLAVRMADLPVGLRQGLVLALLVVFGIKAAVFPLFFWLPDSYPTAPTAVTAVFAGLLTKVGVYAIFRTQTLLLGAPDRPVALLLVVAGATMLVGVLGAIAQNDIKRILSFHIISQIGYMVMGLAFFTVAGLAAGIFYVVHHIVVKTTLFLAGGLVEHRTGTGLLDRVAGMVRSAPVLGMLFLLPALSLAGIPPFSGFVAKLALVQAGFSAGEYAVVAVSLLVSILTLFSMTKIWAGAFWGDVQPPAEEQRAMPVLMVGSAAGLTALSLVVALAAAPLLGVATRAAEDLLDRRVYVETVLAP